MRASPTKTATVTQDEGIRVGTTYEGLSGRTVWSGGMSVPEDRSVTVGNAIQLPDGAVARI